MSVVGIDFGNMNGVIAVARNRGIDVIVNEVSNRTTPCQVSFGQKQRFLGEGAKTQEISNFKNTVSSLKRLVGRTWSDKEVLANEATFVNCDLVDAQGQLGAKVTFQGEEKVFTFIQMCAMYFGKLKEITETETKMPMRDCVVSIPNYFTDAQRRAVLNAGDIAGLNILRLLPDSSAAALQWGITKTDLPETEPRYVAFVDIGQSDYTVSITAFKKGKMMVKGVAYDRNLGGRDFDELLLNHFCEEFKQKYKLDIHTNPKALFRLRLACEKVKKMLSANSQAPLNVECLMNEKDVSAIVERTTFESLATPLMDRLDAVMQRALDNAGITKADLHSVEIVGGTTRIPMVKQKITSFFGKEISTTMNQDECVARGCALMCAIISPVFQVRDFKVEDILPFAIKMQYRDNENGEQLRDMPVFPTGTTLPCTKLLTFYRREAFEVDAHYSDVASFPEGTNPFIGRYTVQKVQSAADGEPSTVKVKVRLNPNGILEIPGAQLVEETEVPVTTEEAKPAEKTVEKKDMEVDEGQSQESPAAEEPAEKDAAPTEKDTASAEKKTKKVVKKTDLPVDGQASFFVNKDALQRLCEIENELLASDRLVIDTEERRNALETYVYELRGKLEDKFSEFIVEKDKEHLMKMLNETEDWLYGDGEDATKSVYASKLDELQKYGQPVAKRFRAAEERPRIVDEMRSTIQELIQEATNADPKYEHIPAAEKEQIVKECQSKLDWINGLVEKQSKLPKTSDPAFTTQQVTDARDALRKQARTILSKPKPAPPKPAAEKEKKETKSEPVSPTEPAVDAEHLVSDDPALATEPTPAAQQMDVD